MLKISFKFHRGQWVKHVFIGCIYQVHYLRLCLSVCSVTLHQRHGWQSLHPPHTWRSNNVVMTSKRRNFDVITSKWRRLDVITTSFLRNVFGGQLDPSYQSGVLSTIPIGCKQSIHQIKTLSVPGDTSFSILISNDTYMINEKRL